MTLQAYELVARLERIAKGRVYGGTAAEARDLIEAQAAEISSLRAKLAEAMEALTDAAAHLTGAASAYDKHATRHRSIKPHAVADPFFTTRVSDFIKAGDRACSAARRLIEGNGNG